MITYNRPEYTKLSLNSLCLSAKENLKITIWDNGSNDRLINVLNKYENNESIERIIFNEKNDKLFKSTNWFWEKNQDADLLGKVDDDCIVPKDWCSILENAHRSIPNAGILASWHFMPEDFDYNVSRRKIKKFGEHKILQNCWVGGSGYLMKKEVIKKIGLLKKKESFTDYCIRAASHGFINGYYYPLIYQKHLDDPRMENTRILSDMKLNEYLPLSAKNFNIKSKEEWIKRIKKSSQIVQQASIDPYDFIGIKSKIRKKLFRIFDKDYYPKFFDMK